MVPQTRPDSVDRFIEASLALFPGVDAETEGVIDRIHKIAKHAKRLIEGTSKRFELNVGEYHTLASLGLPMKVIALNAKLLRDQDGNNLYYDTNSITLAGGESLDVILDASKPEYASCTSSAPCTFYLYTPQMDHLSNDAENFGGMMTEIIVGPSA